MAWRCQVWLYMPFTCEILAGRRSASPRACRCWLPAWLPETSFSVVGVRWFEHMVWHRQPASIGDRRNLCMWLVDKPPRPVNRSGDPPGQEGFQMLAGNDAAAADLEMGEFPGAHLVIKQVAGQAGEPGGLVGQVPQRGDRSPAPLSCIELRAADAHIRTFALRLTQLAGQDLPQVDQPRTK